MYRFRSIGCVAVCIVAVACDQGGGVQAEAEDLREAQKNVGNVTQELEADLAEAKAEIVRLQEKLALARQGITDEVLAERKELEQSLEEQRQNVRGEIKEAQREAREHNRDAELAARELEQTQPPARVEAEVRTEANVVEGSGNAVQVTERQELIPVKGTSVADAGVELEPAPPGQ